MKKFFSFIITVLISILICLLCVSFSLKEIIINTLSKEVVRGEISSKVTQSIKDIYSNIDYETLDKIETSIGNNQNVTEITEKYFDGIVDSIINDKDVNVPNTKEDLLNLIEQNEYILEENGIEITDEQKEDLVDKLTSNGTIDKVYEKVATSIKSNMSDEEVMVVSLYSKITSPTFRWIIFSIIGILILLLSLIKKTYYRWTYNLAISCTLSGIILSLLAPFILDAISLDIANKFLGKTAEININSLVNLGYICFCLCALFIIIYIIGNKISGYNDSKYED